MGKYEEAIKDYTKSIKLNPNDDCSYFFRSTCYEKLGKQTEAAAGEKIYKTLRDNQIKKRSFVKNISLKFYPIKRQLFDTKALW